jgi:adenosine/AMP kinase
MVVMRNGMPIAVLMAVHDEDELDRLVFASSDRLQEILAEGHKEINDGRGIPDEEFTVTRQREAMAASGDGGRD